MVAKSAAESSLPFQGPRDYWRYLLSSEFIVICLQRSYDISTLLYLSRNFQSLFHAPERAIVHASGGGFFWNYSYQYIAVRIVKNRPLAESCRSCYVLVRCCISSHLFGWNISTDVGGNP